jgi:hypothetical protein
MNKSLIKENAFFSKKKVFNIGAASNDAMSPESSNVTIQITYEHNKIDTKAVTADDIINPQQSFFIAESNDNDLQLSQDLLASKQPKSCNVSDELPEQDCPASNKKDSNRNANLSEIHKDNQLINFTNQEENTRTNRDLDERMHFVLKHSKQNNNNETSEVSNIAFEESYKNGKQEEDNLNHCQWTRDEGFSLTIMGQDIKSTRDNSMGHRGQKNIIREDTGKLFFHISIIHLVGFLANNV